MQTKSLASFYPAFLLGHEAATQQAARAAAAAAATLPAICAPAAGEGQPQPPTEELLQLVTSPGPSYFMARNGGADGVAQLRRSFQAHTANAALGQKVVLVPEAYFQLPASQRTLERAVDKVLAGLPPGELPPPGASDAEQQAVLVRHGHVRVACGLKPAAQEAVLGAQPPRALQVELIEL